MEKKDVIQLEQAQAAGNEFVKMGSRQYNLLAWNQTNLATGKVRSIRIVDSNTGAVISPGPESAKNIGRGVRFASTHFNCERIKDKDLKKILQNVCTTEDVSQIGKGRDANGGPANAPKIVSAWRVQNGTADVKYNGGCATVRRICKKYPAPPAKLRPKFEKACEELEKYEVDNARDQPSTNYCTITSCIITSSMIT